MVNMVEFFLKEGYKLVKNLKDPSSIILKKTVSSGDTLITDIKVVDKLSEKINKVVTRYIGKKSTTVDVHNYGIKAPDSGTYMYYRNGFDIKRPTGQERSIILSQDGKNVDFIWTNNGHGNKQLFDYKNGRHIDNDFRTTSITKNKPYRGISELTGPLSNLYR